MRLPSLSTSLLCLLAIIGILPFLLLTAFAWPSADDWYMAQHTMEKGYWRANVEMYLGLSGRFFSSGLLFMHPMLVSFSAFKVYTLALILGLIFSMRWAVGAWIPEASKGGKWALVVMAVVLFLMGMASTAQGFYWGTGSAGYTLPCVLSFCVAGMFGRRCLEPGWSPAHTVLVVCSLLAVAITGCTEVAMAVFLAHVSALNALFFWRHRKISRPLLVLLVATCLGVALVVLTPGNAQRSTWYHNDVHGRFVPAILMALKLAVRQIAVWHLFLPFVLFALVNLVTWPQALQPSRRHAREMVVVAVVLMAGTVLGGFFLGTWSMGGVIPQRAVNLLLLFVIVDWVILLAGLVPLLRALSVELPQPSPVLAVCAFLIFVSGVTATSNNVRTAWRDLISGDAVRYDSENAARNALLRASAEQDVLVPPLQARPRTLFFNDLTSDPTNWRNAGCAGFYRKRAVALKP